MPPASVLLLLVGLCAATEYYVKPTISQETSCPRESCYTLDELAAKYLYASATDVLTDNVTVILLNGTYELKGSIFVSQVNDFTLLGAGGTNGESHVEINCKSVSSLVFEGIVNLTITGITFLQCGVLHKYDSSLQVPHINALTFSYVFNLRLTWVVIHNSTSTAILAENVLGASVIDHLVFQGYNVSGIQGNHNTASEYLEYLDDLLLYHLSSDPSHHIYIWNENKFNYRSHNHSNKTKSLSRPVNSHKLYIHNCVLENGRNASMIITLYHVGYQLELDLMNITIINGGGNYMEKVGDISIYTGNGAIFLVSIRDCHVGHSTGAAIFISVVPLYTQPHTSKVIRISNSTMDKGAAGIDIEDLALQNTTAQFPQIIIENSMIINSGSSDDDTTLCGYGLRIVGHAKQPRLSVALNNVSFESNILGGIFLISVKEIELMNCKFVGNQDTALTLYKSTINVSGTLSFVNNTAYRGGAMAFREQSYMSVSLENKTHILFVNNHAEHVGGAIFAEHLCFFKLATRNCKCSDLRNNRNLSFVFTNNTAHHGGDAIYGGSLQHCIAGYCKMENGVSFSILEAYIFMVKYWNLVQYDTGCHSNLSLISSTPSRVCLCDDGQPDCLAMLANDAHYPGETFSISALVVGQGLGTADGTVHAQFINKHPPKLEELQLSQQVKHSNCAELKYTVFSANKNELMVLSVRPTASESGGFHYNPFKVAYISDQYKYMLKQNIDTVAEMYLLIENIIELLAFEVFINITLLPCPLGFMFLDQPAMCICHTILQQHNITCNIDDQTVHRGGTVWVNASFAGNESNGVIVHHHCPYGYCKREELNIRLDFPDTQCNFNHSGILCGGCRPGLSLTLGTSQCLRCSNKYIALLIPFAIAGIVLVAFIKLLNLTVSEGTLNGLIFYANIIGANQATFFPSTSAQCPVLTVFIAWLNLDLGIEACFIDGLNGYWKTWLQFVFPAYIWIITAVIIVVAHYSSTGARFFGNNSVRVLATLFLLSYTKLLRTIITAISFTILDYPDHLRKAIWLYDGNIQYLSSAHTPLFLVALAVFLFLWLPYTMVLFFMQCIRKKSHHRLLRCFARLKPLFDAYFGPFKDKHCYWVGTMLLMRTILLIISAVNPNNAPKLNLLAIGGTTLLLLAYAATAGKVYKKRYVSFLENSFLFNLGALVIGTSYTSGNGGKSHTAVVHTLVGIAFLQFIGIIVFHGYCSIKISRVWRRFREDSRRCTVRTENRNLDYQPFGEERAQPVRLRMTFNELREPVLEYATDST